jgi:multidrug efflux system membrane fusion protein
MSGLLVLAAAGGCKKAEAPMHAPPTPVRVEIADASAGPNVLHYSATIQPVRQINLSFKVAGYVAGILELPAPGGGRQIVQDGDRVRAGTVMAHVEAADYQAAVDHAQAHVDEAAAGRVQAEAQLGTAVAALSQAQAQLAVAQAGAERAEHDWTRAQALYATQSLTRPEYDASLATHRTAAANLRAAGAGVEAANAQIASARALLAQSAARVESARQQLVAGRIPLGHTALRAPADVVVVSRRVEVGSFVQPAAVGFVVATTDPVKAVFSVPDVVVRTLAPGQILSVASGDAGPAARWRGPITAISPAADPQTRVFQVEVTLANPRGELRLGRIVTVPVGTEAAGPGFPAVPLTSVVRPPGGSTGYAIFVVEQHDGKAVARRREVALGDVLGNRILVREGLRVGERVIVSGATIVTDGQIVNPLR